MKKLAFLGVALGLGTTALLVARTSHAADHLDAPTIRMMANRMADINDVYAWMTSDGNKVNLAMTVSPADDGSRSFGPSIQYVFHVNVYAGATNMAAFGTMGSETDVICTFTSNTQGQCWVAQGTTAKDYVTGNPGATAGISSADGKMRLFAGQRSDPFFFNLGGFLTAQAVVESFCSGPCPAPLPTDMAGCPTLTAAQAGALRTALQTAPAMTTGVCAAGQIDCFANFNVMSIVLQVDKSLFGVDSTHHLLSVWGSTHMAQ